VRQWTEEPETRDFDPRKGLSHLSAPRKVGFQDEQLERALDHHCEEPNSPQET
jgi:hypothetical protein